LTLGSTLGGQPVTGATVGKLDLTVYTTAYSVMRAINASLYWEAWLEDVPCGMLTNKSAGVGVFLVRATTTGYNLVDVASDSSLNQINLDTSVHPTGGKHYVGITFAKGSDFTHATDHQVLHEILEVCAQATFGTTAGTISLYACDDDSGVDTTLESYTYAVASSGTKIYFPVGGNNGEPYQSTKGKRFVAGFSCGISSTADTLAPYLRVIARSYAFGPAVRNSKLWQNQQ
jgi:hypothetical protein